LLASLFHRSEADPSKKANFSLEISDQSIPSKDQSLNLGQSKVNETLSDEYAQLQMRIFWVTIFLSAIAGGISSIFFDLLTTCSLLVGAFCGVLYLRLLARGIGKLGKSKRQVGKIQLIVPVLLVVASSKLPQLELIPALLGFVLYKPSLILQMLLEF